MLTYIPATRCQVSELGAGKVAARQYMDQQQTACAIEVMSSTDITCFVTFPAGNARNQRTKGTLPRRGLSYIARRLSPNHKFYMTASTNIFKLPIVSRKDIEAILVRSETTTTSPLTMQEVTLEHVHDSTNACRVAEEIP